MATVSVPEVRQKQELNPGLGPLIRSPFISSLLRFPRSAGPFAARFLLVGRYDGKVFGESGRRRMSHEVSLGKPMQK
jgi:hypothetical protein